MSLIFIILGILAGLLSGLLGIGGGIFLVPSFVALFYRLGYDDTIVLKCAIGTSLATMTLISLFALLAHLKKTKIEWVIVMWLSCGTMLGALGGAWLADELPTYVIKFAFSLLCIYVSYRLFKRRFNTHQTVIRTNIPALAYIVIGLIVGAISALLGIGGGLLLVPLLIWLGLSFPKASASSIACTFPTVLMGTVGSVIVGLDAGSINGNIGFVLWDVALLTGFGALIGAPLGVKCLYFLPERVVKRIFSLILILIAWQMFPSLLTFG